MLDCMTNDIQNKTQNDRGPLFLVRAHAGMTIAEASSYCKVGAVTWNRGELDARLPRSFRMNARFIELARKAMKRMEKEDAAALLVQLRRSKVDI